MLKDRAIQYLQTKTKNASHEILEDSEKENTRK